jgi:PAS domain S-box-containing protein
MKMFNSNNPADNHKGSTGNTKEHAGHKGNSNVQSRVAFAADLFQSDVTIRTLLESLAEGVVVIDNTATIVLVNKQVERLFGYKKEEIVGRPLNILIPDRFRKAHPEHVADFFAKPKIRPMGLEQELAARHKSGREFPVEISLSHLETASGNLAMAFITDITLRKQAMKSLESRNEELDDFAHTVAHDLRGSLSTLIGFSELLNDSEVHLSKNQVRESIDMIHRISRKMSDVVDGLLLLASVRKEDVMVTPLDMVPIIHEATFRLRQKVEERKAEITFAKDFPSALGYAPWLEEVWYNYISNAIKYGGDPPKIVLGGELTGDGYARFWVKDNGPGLRHAEHSQLFIPYSSRTNSSEGSGLGLSIVKRILEKLNGYVGVESELNKGSVFSFKLPVGK